MRGPPVLGLRFLRAPVRVRWSRGARGYCQASKKIVYINFVYKYSGGNCTNTWRVGHITGMARFFFFQNRFFISEMAPCAYYIDEISLAIFPMNESIDDIQLRVPWVFLFCFRRPATSR